MDYNTTDWPALPPLSTLVNTVHCMEALELLKLLPDNSVDMFLCDPPYGVGKQVSARRSREERFDEIVGFEAINNDWLADAYRTLKMDSAIYMFAKWLNMGDWMLELENVGFDVRNCIIWDKTQHGTGDLFGSYAPQYEMILFAVKGKHKLRGKRPIDIIRCAKVQPQLLTHPYEKPVQLLRKLILNSTDKGNLVLDCFCGSGATCVACVEESRNYIGCEVSRDYYNLSNKRLALPHTPMFAQLAG